LPRGFHRVRSFGLLHPKHRTTFRRLQLMLGRGRTFTTANRSTQGSCRRRCPVCRGTAWRRGPPVSSLELGLLRRPNANENGPRAPPPTAEAPC
jgi:hypothetical protein